LRNQIENLGSESNTVHLYQREISRPLLNYKFDDQNNGTAKTTTATTTTTTAATTTTATNPDRVKKEETGTEFVSAMCWSNVCIQKILMKIFLRFLFLFFQRENVLLAANSQGVVKVLELV
jgi:hypothetical protein